MAKQIIILDRIPGAAVSFRYALWAQVPAARQSFYVNASATSGFAGASAPEMAAIQAGQVRERLDIAQFVTGTPIATITAYLQAAFTQFQADTNGLNNWDKYGTFFDGTVWTNAGVS